MITQLKDSVYSQVIIFQIPKDEIDKIDFSLCKQPRETLESYYNRQTKKPDLLINGGFFNMSDGQTIFNYRDNGLSIAISSKFQEGMGVKDNNQLSFGTIDNSYNDFISGYPVLIRNGIPVTTTVGSEIDYAARRSILAYNSNYIYLIAVNSPGLNFNKVKEVLKRLNCTFAINLDGGGSTRILKNGKLMTEAVVYNRPVDNVIGIYMKPAAAPKTIYRVQTGAFSIRANAEKLQATIRCLPDTIGAGYKNAYIRLINGLYKVQVGAFSKKENAQRVVADLKSKGINSFITTA